VKEVAASRELFRILPTARAAPSPLARRAMTDRRPSHRRLIGSGVSRPSLPTSFPFFPPVHNLNRSKSKQDELLEFKRQLAADKLNA
jgi:hypothetical protein